MGKDGNFAGKLKEAQSLILAQTVVLCELGDREKLIAPFEIKGNEKTVCFHGQPPKPWRKAISHARDQRSMWSGFSISKGPRDSAAASMTILASQ